jgi:hypothetical protein
MNTDKKGLVSAAVLTKAVSPPKGFLIRVYQCSFVVKSPSTAISRLNHDAW